MTFSRTTWRLVNTPPASGAWNMAVDEAILEAAGRGDVPPTLRLYAWAPACLSLGYAQPVLDVDRAALQGLGWELVRRPTGGRAILHTDELTYSVCGPHGEPRLAGDVLQSYRVLAGALLRALHLVGIPAQVQTLPEGRADSANLPGQVEAKSQNPVCFEVPSNYEITYAGKKIIGSAQARRKEGVLQHGSLPLCGDLRRIVQVLTFPNPAARVKAGERLSERATTAEEILGEPLSWEKAAKSFIVAFSEMLNLELCSDALTAHELVRAEGLIGEKYANKGWIDRI